MMLAPMRRAARRAFQLSANHARVCKTTTPGVAAAASSALSQMLSATSRTANLAAVKSFSTDTASSSTNAPPDAVEENRFLELADTALHDIMSWLDGVEEMLEESDISLSQGVLKIDLGEDGTWVINRQIPNRQIWWSSPISGPRRYEFDAETGTWVNTRDGTELMQLLRNEIFDATGIEIFE